ncbi:lipase domain-containing protein [Rhizoctonia solani AG-1 IA]|uniref:Lipase domain-containing protein n=1 Tax=Thanatephorus cucumeris (strain AG1-IA) TaxID=983506 RepID=L8WZM3_THACA|nr:lipase domain-containing protein [Rhizoctonia solani AG-1 IA]
MILNKFSLTGFGLKRTAAVVLSTVKKVIAERGATKVVTVGHSLGGALALLDGLYLRLNLPSNIEIITRTIGQPRVGNDAFAKFVDQKVLDSVPNLVRITNKGDLVPGLPPLILGFKHNIGEKHINRKGEWNACSGQDNLDVNCSTGQLLKQGIVLTDHLGPYAGDWSLRYFERLAIRTNWQDPCHGRNRHHKPQNTDHIHPLNGTFIRRLSQIALERFYYRSVYSDNAIANLIIKIIRDRPLIPQTVFGSSPKAHWPAFLSERLTQSTELDHWLLARFVFKTDGRIWHSYTGIAAIVGWSTGSYQLAPF